jgi:hypothetical protein
MSSEKFEHKDELDCEVTVFEGAHTTCDKAEDDAAEAEASKKTKSRRRKYTDETDIAYG